MLCLADEPCFRSARIQLIFCNIHRYWNDGVIQTVEMSPGMSEVLPVIFFGQGNPMNAL